MPDHHDTFLTALHASIQDDSFVKLTLGSPRDRESGPQKVLIKQVTLARGEHLCFVYRHATKDVTKNLSIAEGLALVRKLLGTDFLSANLFTTANDFELTYNKEHARLRIVKPTHTAPISRQHNRAKNRHIASERAPYLALLGVTHKDGSIKKGMEPKYRQINKFVEIFENLIRSSPLKKADSISIVDMGSGKGYLTFAIYDYISSILKKRARVTGVDVRQELVDLCNQVATTVGFTDLHFECGNIQDFEPGWADVLIALHACDTATDEALFKAIKAEASLVLCAPCCHKELRPLVHCTVPGLESLLESGILLERQAELLTDGLRALLLEACGYKTSVFEFIATEHTSKNIMIAAVKAPRSADQTNILAQIASLKQAFGINSQHLERLLTMGEL